MKRNHPRRALRTGVKHSVPVTALDRPEPHLTKTAALEALGPVVYAVRLDRVIKIGLTGNLINRMSTLRCREHSESADLLAFLPGDAATERALHERLAAHRDHGREYYRETPEVLGVVNEMREALGLDLI